MQVLKLMLDLDCLEVYQDFLTRTPSLLGWVHFLSDLSL